MSMPPTVYDAAEAAIKIERLKQENAALRKALDAQMQYQRDLRADRDRLDFMLNAGTGRDLSAVWRAAIDAATKEVKP